MHYLIKTTCVLFFTLSSILPLFGNTPGPSLNRLGLEEKPNRSERMSEYLQKVIERKKARIQKRLKTAQEKGKLQKVKRLNEQEMRLLKIGFFLILSGFALILLSWLVESLSILSFVGVGFLFFGFIFAVLGLIYDTQKGRHKQVDEE